MRAAREASRASSARCTSCEKRLVDDAAADGRLVGDDDRREAGALEQTQRVGGPRKQREQVEAIEVAALLDERAVAIEKDGRPLIDCLSAVRLGTRHQLTHVANTRSGVRPFMQR